MVGDPILAEIIRRIVAAVDPDEIILFGSRARGTAHENSDYDLLILKAGDYHPRVVAARAHRSLRGVDVSADIIVTTPESFAAGVQERWSILAPAAREGRQVYGRAA